MRHYGHYIELRTNRRIGTSCIRSGYLVVLVLVILNLVLKFVPQNRAYIIDYFGKFRSKKAAGLNLIALIIDRVSADRSLKEQAVDVPEQSAITRDNISLMVDGVGFRPIQGNLRC